MTNSLSYQEQLDLLRLTRSENIGPITFKKLMERYGTAAHALQEIPRLAQRGGKNRPIRIATVAEVERELDRTFKAGVYPLFLIDPEYPPLLAEIEDSPPLLFCLGHRHLLKRDAIAVVGSRNASTVGRKIARQLSGELSRQNLTITSGMARGIDAAAHDGGLSSAGSSIAVLAGGVDHVYPRENQELYQRLVEIGCVISEMPVGSEPLARHFVGRNRIISGLSLLTLVVEAAAQSGSLHTARFANEQGREVMAVPGSPLDPRASGCLKLIKDGAGLAENADDILNALANIRRRPLRDPDQMSLFAPSNPLDSSEAEQDQARKLVTELLSPVPIEVDEILRQCQIAPGLVLMVLLELELAGRLERNPGGKVALIDMSPARLI